MSLFSALTDLVRTLSDEDLPAGTVTITIEVDRGRWGWFRRTLANGVPGQHPIVPTLMPEEMKLLGYQIIVRPR
jgi:hypothetical protein